MPIQNLPTMGYIVDYGYNDIYIQELMNPSLMDNTNNKVNIFQGLNLYKRKCDFVQYTYET